jgi:hypothetical protein
LNDFKNKQAKGAASNQENLPFQPGHHELNPAKADIQLGKPKIGSG